MKIADVRSRVVISPDRMEMTGYAGAVQRDIVLVEVITDDGHTGVASAWVPRHPARLLAEAATAAGAIAIGHDPRLLEKHWQDGWHATRQTLHMMGPGLIDTALWDLLGRLAGLPLYRLLGAHRDRVTGYASTTEHHTIEEYVDACVGYVEQGFRAVKLHPWGEPVRDIELYEAVREALPDEIALMTDCVGRYDRRGALRVGKVLDELEFHWYEEPLPDGDLQGYVDLARTLRVPVAGVDSVRLGLGQYTQYIAAGAFDIVRADAGRQGITFCRKLGAIAEGFGVNLEPHGFGPGLTQAANLHVSASIANCEFMEVPAPVGDMDLEIVGGLTLDRDGTVALPEAPGLGVEVDWERVDRLTAVTLSPLDG